MHRQRFARVSLLVAGVTGSDALAQSPPGTAAVSSSPPAAADTTAARAPAPPGEPPAPSLFADLQANAFVSFGYTYALNRPSDRLNRLRVFDESANTFDVDVAELVLQRPVTKPGDAGFRVDLVAGGAIPEKTQSVGLSIGRSADLQQAFLSYLAPVERGLRLDFGKFVTHMGYETIEGYDGYDDQYSRSFLFDYAIPFTHTGVRASYPFGRAVSATLMVVNGWDAVRDNNAGKSVGAQLALTPAPPLAVYLNYIGGPEKADTAGHARHVVDLVATWKPRATLTLGLNGDYGIERGASAVAPGANATWMGAAGYAQYALTRRLALAVRGETFRDAGGTRLGTGARTSVREVTLTPTFRFTDRFLVRGDVRLDAADRDVFVRDAGVPRRRQTTLAGNAVFVY